MTRRVVLTSALLAACSSPPPSPRLDAPMVDLPVASSAPPPSSAPAQLATTTDLPAEPARGSFVARPRVSARDSRRSVAMARSPALLATEAQALEQLLDATSPGAPDRPQLLRRLAEDYVELSRSLAREGRSDARAARRKAIGYYERLVREAPSYAMLDEVLYFVGLEYELDGDLANARKSYYELIKRSPNSNYVPPAYFAFGEMFFDEAKADPSKLDLANQAFTEVIKYPSPANVVFADALLRLGQIADQRGDGARAKTLYARLKRDFPTSEAASAAP